MTGKRGKICLLSATDGRSRISSTESDLLLLIDVGKLAEIQILDSCRPDFERILFTNDQKRAKPTLHNVRNLEIEQKTFCPKRRDMPRTMRNDHDLEHA